MSFLQYKEVLGRGAFKKVYPFLFVQLCHFTKETTFALIMKVIVSIVLGARDMQGLMGVELYIVLVLH